MITNLSSFRCVIFGYIASIGLCDQQAFSDLFCLLQQQGAQVSPRRFAVTSNASAEAHFKAVTSSALKSSHVADNALALAGEMMDAEHKLVDEIYGKEWSLEKSVKQVPLMHHQCQSLLFASVSFMAAVVAEICFATIGVGPATIMLVYLQLMETMGIASVGAPDAMWCVIIMQLPVSIFQVGYLRSHWNTQLVILFNAPLLVFLPVGAALMNYIGSNTPIINAIIGFFFLSVAAFQAYERLKPKEEKDEKIEIEYGGVRGVSIAVTIMCATGFCGGFFGTICPVLVLLFVFFSIERNLWRLLTATVGLSYAFVQAALLPHGTPHFECAPMYIALMLGGLTGLAIGNMASKHLDENRFHVWLISFLAVAGLLMICNKDRTLSYAAAVWLGVIVTGILLEPIMSSCAARALQSSRSAQNLGMAGITLPSPQSSRSLANNHAKKPNDPGCTGSTC